MVNEPDDTAQSARTHLAVNPLFLKQPPQYYQYALQWFMYPKWTVEESANLLAGCVPHRKLFLKGPENEALDAEVVEVENRIRRALGTELEIIKSKKYFSTVYVERTALLNWARTTKLPLPYPLLRARRAHEQRTEQFGYTTPCMEALQWVVSNYWQGTDFREPPASGEIIQALLGQFPELTAAECEMIEHISRHPLARPGASDP